MASRGSSLAVVLGHLIAVNSLVEHRFSGVQASVVAAHRPSRRGPLALEQGCISCLTQA